MLQETAKGTLKISVSDPTMKNQGEIRIMLGKDTVLIFRMAGKNGRSCLQNFQYILFRYLFVE